MTYAIELSPRQTTRTLEQAIRHRADVLLVPRVRPDEQPILCHLDSVGPSAAGSTCRPCLVILPVGETDRPSEARPQIDSTARARPAQYEQLIGTYCDVTIQLGYNRYLFCSDVVAVGESPPGTGEVAVFIARPPTIQVTQRRRFWRFRPERSSQVELSWLEPDRTPRSSTGWLCNVSGDGLACRVETRVADQLAIGGPLKTEFALAPGDPERFTLDAVLCSKTPAGTQGTMILGLQFAAGPGRGPSPAAEALRRRLMSRYARAVNVPKGADA